MVRVIATILLCSFVVDGYCDQSIDERSISEEDRQIIAQIEMLKALKILKDPDYKMIEQEDADDE